MVRATFFLDGPSASYGIIGPMRRAVIIAGSLALLTRIAIAGPTDGRFYVVKLCYTGDRSVLKVLDGRQYEKLTKKMQAGGSSEAFASGARESSLAPKWMILRGTFPTREAAEAMLGKKKVDPKVKAAQDAARKAKAEQVLLLESMKTKHEPTKYDKERATEGKKKLKKIRDSMKTETKHKVKHYLGDPLTDKLVNTDRLVEDSPLTTTDIHKLDKVKVEHKGNYLTVKDGKSKSKQK